MQENKKHQSIYVEFFFLFMNKLEEGLSEIEFIQSIYSKLDYNNSNTRKIINNLIKLCKNKYYPYDEDYYMKNVFTPQIIEILKFKKELNYPENLEKLIDLIIIYSLTSSNHKSFRVFENYKEILKFIKKIILIKDERLYNILTNIFSLKFINSRRNSSYSLIDNIIKIFNQLTANKSLDLKIINLCFYALLERSSNQNNPQFSKANEKITNVSISTCKDFLGLNKILYDLNIINTKYTKQIIELYKKLQIVFKNNIDFIDFISLFENKKEFKIKEFLNNIDINRIEKIKDIYDLMIQNPTRNTSKGDLIENLKSSLNNNLYFFLNSNTDLIFLNNLIIYINKKINNIENIDEKKTLEVQKFYVGDIIRAYYILVSSDLKTNSIERYNYLLNNLNKKII